MGVLGGPLGYFWESLRVPWGHFGSARGALAVLEIIEKPLICIIFPGVGDPWPTLGRLWFVLWGRWVLFGVLGRSLGVPRASLRALGIALGSLGVPWRVPRRSLGPSRSSGFSSTASDLAIIAFSHDLSALVFDTLAFGMVHLHVLTHKGSADMVVSIPF